MVLFNDSVYDGKTEARSLADLFCCKERFEYLTLGHVIHAGTVVRYRNAGIFIEFPVPV